MTARGWFLFSLMGVVWGIPYLLIKVAIRDLWLLERTEGAS